MRAIEFIIESNNIASAEQVWDYVDGSHPKDQQGGGFLKSLVMRNPQYELKRVPLSSLHVPNDKDEGNDPYGRAMFVDVDHAREYSQHHIDKKPLVIDSQGHILDGAHRAWAASELLNKTDIMAWVPVKQSVAEDLNEAVSDNYLYHATMPAGMMRILRTGIIKATDRPQSSTKSKTQYPTISTTRSKQYAESNDFVDFLNLTKDGNSVILVFDRTAVANHYKMFSTSQGTQTVGDEYEEVIVAPKGSMPIKGTLKGFYFNPRRTEEIEGYQDVPWFNELLNSPYYMGQKQGMAEGKITLSTDPNWYGATVDNYQASGPVVNIPANQLVGFEPDDKMNQPKSKVNVEKIVAGLKQGSKLPPLLVRKYKNGYQVLDGHHRFWAYKLLGVKSIPAQIVPDSDIEEISKQGVAEDN
jgi:hypothetical protein